MKWAWGCADRSELLDWLGTAPGEGKLTAEAVRALLAEAPDLLPAADVAVAEVALAAFDELLGGGAEVLQ